MDLAEFLQNERKQRGLSQRSLALLAFDDVYMQSVLSRYERGLTSPTVDTLQKIADALDCELVIEFREKDKK